MNSRLACNYAVIRFLPYVESGEFVNVGVVLSCPRTGYFDFRLERRKFRRISNFFPELKPEAFRRALASFAEEMERVREQVGVYGETRPQLPLNRDLSGRFFAEIVRPRENIFRCSEARTALAEAPAILLDALFERYVERLFAVAPDFQEEVMRKRLAETLRGWKMLQFYKERLLVGNEEYSVRFPFARETAPGAIDRAIKPLNLDQTTTTRIFDHGEQWVARISRLRRMGLAPKRILFTVQGPAPTDKRFPAFEEVCRELREQEALVVSEHDTGVIRQFAEIRAGAAGDT